MVERARAMKGGVGFKRRSKGSSGAAAAAAASSPQQQEQEKSFECALCFEDLPDSARRFLPCGHSFCPCVRTWLKEHGSCPVCREKASSKTLQRHAGGANRFVRRAAAFPLAD